MSHCRDKSLCGVILCLKEVFGTKGGSPLLCIPLGAVAAKDTSLDGSNGLKDTIKNELKNWEFKVPIFKKGTPPLVFEIFCHSKHVLITLLEHVLGSIDLEQSETVHACKRMYKRNRI